MPAIKTEKQRYARGLKRRKQVLGAKYVAERLKNRHPFTDEFRSLSTRYAWGELSAAELKEGLMLAAIYCGVPAANSAFGHARKFIKP
jgi:4-carboxymuconolactone decarboxylase